MSLRSLWATGPVLPSPMGLPSKWVTPMHSCAVPRIIISRTESSSACGMGRISTGMNVLASSIALVATVPTSAFLNSGSTNAPLASTTATLAMAGQAAVRVKGQGDVHVLLHGLKRHEDGGKVVGRLEAGEHGGLDRHVAAEGGEALVVPCVSAHRDAVGGHV